MATYTHDDIKKYADAVKLSESLALMFILALADRCADGDITESEADYESQLLGIITGSVAHAATIVRDSVELDERRRSGLS